MTLIIILLVLLIKFVKSSCIHNIITWNSSVFGFSMWTAGISDKSFLSFFETSSLEHYNRCIKLEESLSSDHNFYQSKCECFSETRFWNSTSQLIWKFVNWQLKNINKLIGKICSLWSSLSNYLTCNAIGFREGHLDIVESICDGSVFHNITRVDYIYDVINNVVNTSFH